MARKTFTTDYLRNELGLPFDSTCVISDEISDTGRWSILHDLIFTDPADGKCYQVGYSVGATENQDERPWEYENTVTATEVEKRVLLREEYVDVESTEKSLDQMIARAAEVLEGSEMSQATVINILRGIFIEGEQMPVREEVASFTAEAAQDVSQPEAETPPAASTQPVSSPAFQKFFEKLKKRLDDIFYLDSVTTILDLPDEPSYTDSFAIHCTDGTDLYYQLSALYERYQEYKERDVEKPIKRIVAGMEADYDHHDIGLEL